MNDRQLPIQKSGSNRISQILPNIELKIGDIPERDRLAFMEDLQEDLKEIDHSRIVGLGITPKQLDNWLQM